MLLLSARTKISEHANKRNWEITLHAWEQAPKKNLPMSQDFCVTLNEGSETIEIKQNDMKTL